MEITSSDYQISSYPEEDATLQQKKATSVVQIPVLEGTNIKNVLRSETLGHLIAELGGGTAAMLPLNTLRHSGQAKNQNQVTLHHLNCQPYKGSPPLPSFLGSPP